MRSLALIALGSLIASASLPGQSLAEHAAAAAGATVGTAAGKPLGTALGNIFGNMNKDTSKAAGTTVVKPAEPKTEPKPEPAGALAPAPPLVTGTGGSPVASVPSSGSARRARRHESPAPDESGDLAPIPPPIAPIAPIVPAVKELSVEQVASVPVGATFNDLKATLGPPESRVIIPEDGGHLLEICQYWSKGQALGTIRLDNGHVISIQTRAN
jgi:hypothetical protein